jgi:hypothetical protein
MTMNREATPTSRNGTLTYDLTANTATWAVDGRNVVTIPLADLVPLAELALAQRLGEVRDLLREACALPDLAVLAYQMGVRAPAPEIRTRIHTLQERIGKAVASPGLRAPPVGRALGPDGRAPGQVLVLHHIACPECGRPNSSIDHLVADAEKRGAPVPAGPWFCDECGCSFNVLVHADASVSVEKREERQTKTAVLLRLRDSGDHPLHVVVHDTCTNYLGDPLAPEARDAERYLYEDHLCPESILRRVACVIANGDTDAHGLFEMVAIRARSDAEESRLDHSSAEELFASFGVELKVRHDD